MKGQKTILIADDSSGIVALLEALCADAGYRTISAANGREAVEKAAEERPDLIVMDGSMPAMDGYEATRRIKADPSCSHIPVVMLTGMDTREDRLRGFSAGANDFLTKPVDAEEFSLRVSNNLKVKEYHDFLEGHATILEEQVRQRTEDIFRAMETIKSANAEIAQSYVDTIYRLAIVSEFKDADTGTHIKRIGYFARELAAILGMDSEYGDNIYQASMMHDIGKVNIPDTIMLKRGELTPPEWTIMKSHTGTGARILSGSSSPYLMMAEHIAGSHHEHWDGGGYPSGMGGEDIPLAARITNIVDQYDALRSRRHYKDALRHADSMLVISRGDGRTLPSHFDPEVLAAFSAHAGRFDEIYGDLTGQRKRAGP